jgi:hypothetical protein
LELFTLNYKKSKEPFFGLRKVACPEQPVLSSSKERVENEYIGGRSKNPFGTFNKENENSPFGG